MTDTTAPSPLPRRPGMTVPLPTQFCPCLVNTTRSRVADAGRKSTVAVPWVTSGEAATVIVNPWPTCRGSGWTSTDWMEGAAETTWWIHAPAISANSEASRRATAE